MYLNCQKSTMFSKTVSPNYVSAYQHILPKNVLSDFKGTMSNHKPPTGARATKLMF